MRWMCFTRFLLIRDGVTNMTNESLSMATSVATLGGGCFWCLEAVFERMVGVLSVRSGYSGGQVSNPDYASVCGGATGHAEVVEIRFDEAVTPYRDLLEVFFAIHDPTTKNRQGHDVGTQYRSVIFTHSASQHDAAQAMIAQMEARREWPAPIVTEVLPAAPFYVAEEGHQHYFATHPHAPYCQSVVAPKVRKFLQKFPVRAKPEVA